MKCQNLGVFYDITQWTSSFPAGMGLTEQSSWELWRNPSLVGKNLRRTSVLSCLSPETGLLANASADLLLSSRGSGFYLHTVKYLIAMRMFSSAARSFSYEQVGGLIFLRL